MDIKGSFNENILGVTDLLQTRVLRFPPPVKLTFRHHRHRLEMTLAVAEALSHNKNPNQILQILKVARGWRLSYDNPYEPKYNL